MMSTAVLASTSLATAADGSRRRRHRRRKQFLRHTCCAASSQPPPRTDALGGVDFIYSQKSGVEEMLFKGDVLGVDADVSTGDLRVSELRNFGNIALGDYHIPERFLDRFTMHVVKNMLVENNAEIGRVPLILGIWGGKGCGKSFNVELCCRELGITPIVTSAGELEDPTAGEPGALLRRRYLTAAKAMRETGRLTCMVINDLDAGVGRFKEDKVTVNNQVVQATLMNLCDEPNRVSVGAEWRSDDRARCARVPIIVTGNDMSRVYAPLTRSGRMDLWMWEPAEEELVAMVDGLLKDDRGYRGESDAAALVAAFPGQPLDFFAAARSRCVDDAVRAWVAAVGMSGMGEALMSHRRRSGQGGGGAGGERCLAEESTVVVSRGSGNVSSSSSSSSPSPSSSSSSSSTLLAKSDVSLEALLRAGLAIAKEQQNVMDIQLAKEYVKNWSEAPAVEEIRARRRAERAREAVPTDALQSAAGVVGKRAAAEAAAAEAARSPETLAAAAAARDAMLATMAAEGTLTDDERRTFAIGVTVSNDEAGAESSDENLPWRVLDAIECYRMLNGENGSRVGLLDIRPGKDHNREAVKGSISAPAATVTGGISDPVVSPDVEGMVAALAGDAGRVLAGGEGKTGGATVIVVHDGRCESYAHDALRALVGAGYTDVVEMRGGMEMWLKYYTPSGKPRPRYVGYGKDNEETFWTASN